MTAEALVCAMDTVRKAEYSRLLGEGDIKEYLHRVLLRSGSAAALKMHVA